MSTAVAISLLDAQATPVAHVFTPVGKDDVGTFWFVDQSAVNAIGFWKISVEIKQPGSPQPGESSAKRVSRFRIGLHEPVLETLGTQTVSGIIPAPTVSYIPRSFHEFVIPERATLLDRKNVRKMSSLLLADANIISVVENLNYLT